MSNDISLNRIDQRRRMILVVDDQEINRSILELILQDSYELLFAENGLDALKIVQEHKNTLSAVLLDLMMPLMDGFEVLKIMKSDETTKKIPVIVLTSEKAAELNALKLGAADFITKPFDVHEVILARLSRIIELNEGRHLIKVAEKDELTGLYTENLFHEYIDQFLKFNPHVNPDYLVINIEKFRTINILFGHDVGDKTLKNVAAGIQKFLTTTQGYASRVESDRFQLFCLYHENYGELNSMINEALKTENEDYQVRVRIGVCRHNDSFTPQVHFEHASQACNKMRNNYSSNIMFFDEEMYRKELYYESLTNSVERAIKEKQFVVYYQPKYYIQGDVPHLKSAEALVRWIHPEFGMISPGDFIPLFEKNGLINTVDNYVWGAAASQVAEWKKEYGIELHVSVNVSRANIFDPKLEKKLLEIIASNNLSVKDINLEITESAYTEDSDFLKTEVEKLRANGFQIEMDDFGSGFSSLNMLSTLPIDVLKMDMKFIHNIHEENKDMGMVKLIIGFAKYLKVPVIAEGVETEEQMRLLKDAGCDYVQGYYFSKPVPAADFEKLIEKELELLKEEKK